MVFALVLALAVGSVQGMATSDGGPLPGCTVSLASTARTKHAITNHEGKYQFYSVEPGVYDLLIELPGMEPVSRTIVVAEGVNELPAEELAVRKDVQIITVSCTLGIARMCQEGVPNSVWEVPSCADYELNRMLIASAEAGDRSAIELLRSRYAQAATYSEKHTIASALLRRVPDDRVYWNELFEHARNAVRFASDGGNYTDEFVQWCQSRLYEPGAYQVVAYGAFNAVAGDPRGRELRLAALEGGVSALVPDAILGSAVQRDLNALPAIERALAQALDAPFLADLLEPYRHEQADRLAFRYLDEDEREDYLEARNAPEE